MTSSEVTQHESSVDRDTWFMSLWVIGIIFHLSAQHYSNWWLPCVWGGCTSSQGRKTVQLSSLPSTSMLFNLIQLNQTFYLLIQQEEKSRTISYQRWKQTIWKHHQISIHNPFRTQERTKKGHIHWPWSQLYVRCYFKVFKYMFHLLNLVQCHCFASNVLYHINAMLLRSLCINKSQCFSWSLQNKANLTWY